MEVVSLSPLPVASMIWQSGPGAWTLTFVAKATCQIQPGKSPLASAQEPVHEEDCHWDDDDARSLFAASDLVPLKPRVDVTLVGSAFAPQGQPVRSLFARLIIGDLDKSIEVHQDRTFTADGALVEGPRFSRMSLAYERAAGGPDTTNPVGVRADVRDSFGRLKLPNLQSPGLLISSASTLIAPVGFGPVAPGWPLRRGKLGRYAASFTPHSLIAAPLPDDLDRSFFNVAPGDQQLAELAEDARVVLENMHPQIPRLVTNLPGLRPRAVLEARGGAHVLPLRCDTLWIDTDRQIATLTFRGRMQLERLEEPGRIVVTLEEATSVVAAVPAAPVRPANPETVIPPPPPKPRGATMTMIAEDDEGISTVIPQDPRGTPASRQPTALPFKAAPAQHNIADERTTQSGGLPFAATPQPAARAAIWDERTTQSGGLPFAKPTQTANPWPAAPAAPQKPPPPPARASSSGWQAPIVPGQPPSAPPSPVVAPPPPAPVQPPPPVARASQPAGAARPAEGDSVWGAGISRGDAPAGQSIGQVVVAASAAAAQSSRDDATAGVLGASNAAAGPSNATTAGKRDDVRISPTAFGAGVRPSGRLDTREVLHLIWYNPESVARVCRVPVWRAILEEMEKKPADDNLDDPAPTKDPIEIEDTRDIFEILSRGASQDVDQLEAELGAAVRPGNKFVPSLLLLAGDLSFPFDERKTLEAAVAVATPIAGADEGLKTALREAREFLMTPGELCPAPIVEGYTARIREAFQRSRRAITLDTFESQIERALVEGRHYQRRQVLGMNAIRAYLHTTTGTGARPAPVYIPEDLAKKLPLFQKFRARLLVELYFQEDQYEPHPAALKALAIGRVQSSDRR
ncbi:DUF2169 domain-containing protein [Polyangium sp. 6x1]|uniref:DUF2169 family type VI secretion system accessory protein n=1 Tax=Polyangium sp. 6x1 TaxID=3042689 RepID=UPI00248275D1|nr:DUF2169 domain-containing protein [Polyangium sp. 6x1]MDI1446202.1 DUF2169 domain-containing protein [Polyangium sp. 6x1]